VCRLKGGRRRKGERSGKGEAGRKKNKIGGGFENRGRAGWDAGEAIFLPLNERGDLGTWRRRGKGACLRKGKVRRQRGERFGGKVLGEEAVGGRQSEDISKGKPGKVFPSTRAMRNSLEFAAAGTGFGRRMGRLCAGWEDRFATCGPVKKVGGSFEALIRWAWAE